MRSNSILRHARKIRGQLWGLAAGLLAFLLYARTAAPSLTWAQFGADGGDLIAAASTWGVPHPSGYPTYCLLARAFHVLVPLDPPARSYNLFSALCGAISVWLAYHGLRLALAQRGDDASLARDVSAEALAATGALAWATSPLLWSQATISEVYTLHSAFWAGLLYLGLAQHNEYRVWRWWALGLLTGLGLGNHLTLLAILAGLVILLWPQRSWRAAGTSALGALLGLSVYLYIPLAARHLPPVNWGKGDTWAGFRWLVSGELYRGYLFGLSWSELSNRLAALAALWRQQYTAPGLALALIGLYAWGRKDRRLLGATLASGLIVACLALGYNTADSFLYLLPFFLLSAYWMTQGTLAVAREIFARGQSLARWTSSALLLAIALWSAVQGWPSHNLGQERKALDWWRGVEDTLPPAAILVTRQDRYTFTARYMQWVEGRRTDVIVIDADLLAHDWYRDQIRQRAPRLVLASADLEGFLQVNGQSEKVYLAEPWRLSVPGLRLTRTGDLWSVTESHHRTP